MWVPASALQPCAHPSVPGQRRDLAEACGKMNFLMDSDYSKVVGVDSLERELNWVRAAAAGGSQGVFGPRSLTWQVDRESAIFLGAGRALLLQLAHPWVAAAIDQHSGAFADPIGRFHRTFSTVFAMVFGTLDQSLNAARNLHRRHTTITGQLPWTAGPFAVGSTYSANAIPALRWVYATLIDTALVAYELVLPPLTAEQREHYYRESQLFAGLFGIPKECLPPGWGAFSDYFATMVQSETLAVSARTRNLARRLLMGSDLWLPVPASYQDLTLALLPAPLHERFGFSFGNAQKRAVRAAVALTRRFYALLPARLRYVGPYWEAERRLAGRATPDFVTRLSNRFWIGRGELSRG
jgi:uncharacterized protein (DUF2236 family)